MALTLTAENVGDWFRKLKLFYGAVRDMGKPVVVALNGVAAGAGFQLSLHSDLRIAHAGVRMSQPEINAGIPSVVSSEERRVGEEGVSTWRSWWSADHKK